MSTYRGLDYIGVSRMKGSRASDRSERVNRTGTEERVFSLYLTRETRARACVDLKGPSLFFDQTASCQSVDWERVVVVRRLHPPTRDDDEVRASGQIVPG